MTTRNLALVPGVLVLVAAVVAAAWLAAERTPVSGNAVESAAAARVPAPPASPAAAAPAPAPAGGEARTIAELQARLAEMEKRLAALEARPQLPEAVDDPAVRERLAEALRRPRPEEGPANQVRALVNVVQQRAADYFRAGYDRLLEEARKRTGLDEAKWRELAPVFNKHYEPVEKALRANGQDGLIGGLKINELVAAQLPETLAALQQGLPEPAWKAFDTWRRDPEGQLTAGLGTRGDYFLAADDLRKVQSQAAVERRWQMVSRSLPKLQEALGAEGDKAKNLEAALRGHVEKFSAAFGGQAYVNALDEENREKARKLSAETGEELRKLFGEDGLKKFEEWRKSPDNLAGMLFGEIPGRAGWGRQHQRHPGPQLEVRPNPAAPQPAPKGGPEVF